MAFEIKMSPVALGHMKRFSPRDRRVLWAAIRRQLSHDPAVETAHRKRMRPNPFFPWQLSVEPFRVFYDVSATERLVVVLAIGEKHRSVVRIGGEIIRL